LQDPPRRETSIIDWAALDTGLYGGLLLMTFFRGYRSGCPERFDDQRRTEVSLVVKRGRCALAATANECAFLCRTRIYDSRVIVAVVRTSPYALQYMHENAKAVSMINADSQARKVTYGKTVKTPI
jgi:hypothetical protein